MVWEFKVFVLDFFLFGGFAFSVYSLAICLWFHYFCFGGGTSVLLQNYLDLECLVFSALSKALVSRAGVWESLEPYTLNPTP